MGHLTEALADFKGESFHVLLYHSISNETRYRFSVSPEDFAWHMEWLYKQGAQVQSLSEALSREGSSNQKLRVVITFDDGYEDNFTTALPILRKYGYKATFFITTNFVGKVNLWEEDRQLPQLRLMTWQQISTLSAEGHIIGGHTHRHINLLKTADLNKIREDLAESKHLITENTDASFIPLAYPYGKYSKDTVDIVKELGYSCALTAGGFWGNNPNIDNWHLRREDIHRGTTRRHFMVQARGARDPYYIKMGFDYSWKALLKM